MPQMSPLMWLVLMLIFVFVYFVLSISLYFNYCNSVNFTGLANVDSFLLFW